MKNENSVENFDDVQNFHDIEIKSSIKPELLCRRCHRVMQNAAQLSCGCRFCRRCIEGGLLQGTKCPSCESGTNADIFPDHAINKDIGKLLVECPLCRDSMKMKIVKLHLDECHNESIRELVEESRAVEIVRETKRSLSNPGIDSKSVVRCAGSSPTFGYGSQETHSWNIRNFPAIFEESKRYPTASYYSDPFYTRDGYHMQWIIYPYGKGIYRGSHISMFYVIMKGDHDDRLQWPFNMELCFWIQNPKDQDYINEKRIPANKGARCNAKPLGVGVENGVVNFLDINEVDKFAKDGSLSIKCSMKRG